MRKLVYYLLLLVISSVSFFSCKKDIESVGDNLPEATQTGANTFGCLVNGKVFVPNGYDGTGTPNPHTIYDIGLNGRPYLSIDVNKFSKNQSIANVFIAFGNLDHSGYYQSPNDFNFSVGWPNVIGTCGTIAFDSTIQKWGGINHKIGYFKSHYKRNI